MASVDEVAPTQMAASGGMGAPKLAAWALGPLAVALALLSAAVTFLVLTGLTPIIPTHEVVVSVLLANLATVLILLAVIVREVGVIVQARRRGRAGARMRVV
jgi:two-component system, NtrC family, nitrogen regulation sensor histidine kinase NtrY